MIEKIDPALLKKYLAGMELNQTELSTIEKVLSTDNTLAIEIAESLPNVALETILKKGIQQAGKAVLKKKINSVENNLSNNGFFIDEAIIQSYLEGTLDGNAERIFENRLQQDEAFVQRVEQEQNLLNGLKKAGQNRLKEKLKNVQEGLDKKGFFEEKESLTTEQAKSAKVFSIFNKRNLAIAASLLILVLAYFNFPTQSNLDIEQTFASHFPYQDKISESIEDEISEIGYTASEKEIQEQLLAALAVYNQEKYNEAIPLFNQILSQKPDQLYAQLYLGQSYLNVGNWGEASKLLQPLGENISFPLRADALWGNAYSFLKQEKNQKAIPILQQLTQFENQYQKAATALLASL